jgi:hypothetical protein
MSSSSLLLQHDGEEAEEEEEEAAAEEDRPLPLLLDLGMVAARHATATYLATMLKMLWKYSLVQPSWLIIRADASMTAYTSCCSG